MKERSRANALLVELLLVIFFFMISAAILVQVFADARIRSRTARATNASMLEAENIAESLYAAKEPDAVLADYGFHAQDDCWVLEKEGYYLKVSLSEKETEEGILQTYEVSGIERIHDDSGAEKEQTLLTLPSARYIPKEVSP